jgi:signal transduction histidine kinase
MNKLIDDLLKFSRIEHVELRRENINLRALAHEVVTILKQAEPERKVDFKSKDEIVAHADASLMRVVLDNLLGNAWKYTGMQEAAVIEFGTTEIDNKPVYFVRDNGTGFDKTDEDKLFVPFQRLPGAENFKGSGIGLATVRRIIQLHGGDIWAEGEPGKGACFYFTLSAD